MLSTKFPTAFRESVTLAYLFPPKCFQVFFSKDKMAAQQPLINGKFLLVKMENHENFLRGGGLSEEYIKLSMKPGICLMLALHRHVDKCY